MFPHVIVALTCISILFMLISLGIPNWPCGTIFGNCSGELAIFQNDMRSVGALLCISVILMFVTLGFAVAVLWMKQYWVSPAGFAIGIAASIFAIAGEFTYYSRVRADWSAFLAAISMTIIIQITVLLGTNFVKSLKESS
ncbi:unnamed protein product [Dibothriocephalus latus]|uniref:Uncharacterized protein n=1 Tax=Dibothriocephalus latus TaxID=60516 RepID=A0A3P7LJR7_DIBLA|nr:unnamed protein product [Dibothriocephalus latus]